jgi:hypothetical protein
VTGGAELGRLVVLGLLALCQGALLWRAWIAAHADDSLRLAELSTSFTNDLKQRARRGEGPDWLRYQAELDRLFEARDDGLRSLAAAALALGLGGTLLALLVSLGVQRLGLGQELDPRTILESTGLCLVGSLLGVMVNLAIVLGLLPVAEKRFASLAGSLRQQLASLAGNHPPQEALAAALQEALRGLRQVLDAELTDSFGKAVSGWPQVVEKMGAHVEALGSVIQAQSAEVGGAVRDLAAGSQAVAAASAELRPAAERLGETATTLVELPTRLQAAVDASREGWLAGLREQQEQAVHELVALQRTAEEASQARERVMLAAVRELQAAVAEVQAAVARIPGQLAEEVARTAGKLGREFGNEARAHTLELADRLERKYEELLTRVAQHEQQWRNNIAGVVEELLAKVAGHVEQGVVAQLRGAGAELQKVAADLVDAAPRIEQALAEWSRAQHEALAGWDQVSDRTRAAAERLAQADGELGAGVVALKESASHLERIAHLNGEFETSLQAAVGNVAARHLAGLEPFHQELMAMARNFQRQQGELGEVLERQSAFVRRCIEVLMKGRQLATLERTA